MIRVGILGVGLIGLDLVHRITRSADLDCRLVVGRRRTTGLRLAEQAGCRTEVGGPECVAEHADELDLVFDASDAAGHAQLLEALGPDGPRVVDLTPSHLGVPIVPTVNASQCPGARDVSLVSCAGQATIPVLHAVCREYPPAYVEIVTTAASATAGPATRRNLDEFIDRTGSAVAAFTGSPEVKVLANISPATARTAVPGGHDRTGTRAPGPGPVAPLAHRAAEEVRSHAPGLRASRPAPSTVTYGRIRDASR